MATDSKSKSTVDKLDSPIPPAPKRKKNRASKEVVVTSVTDPPDFATSESVKTVDVADIKEIKGEDSHILLTGESWVVLGKADGVPDWAVGQVAAVVDAPISHKYDGDLFLYDYTAPDALITVRERSQGGTFSVPLDTCTKVSIVGGRGALVNFP